MDNKTVKVAIIDLYNNEPNQGMRCLQDILKETDGKINGVRVVYDIYETRYKGDVPGSGYDIYLSSGGPGSPFDGEGTQWEKDYFGLLDKIWAHNNNHERKKYIFFICHSFQIMARYFKFGQVIKRKSRSFGIVPIHKTGEGKKDPLLMGLPDIFYGADFRSWQVVQPNKIVMDELGAKILCLEKIRPHVPLERALMAVRISNEIVGTQFHPEADPESMYYHFKKPEKQAEVIKEYGEKKLREMVEHLENPDNITLTRNTVLPNFLRGAISELFPVEELT